MIDEQVLERALRTEAETYALPPDGPAMVREAVEEHDPRPRRALWALAAAAAVIVGVVAFSSGGAIDRVSPSGYLSTGSDYAGRQLLPGGGELKGASPADEAHVARTGELTVEVANVPDALASLTRLASARRGFVSESRTDGTPDVPSGTVTLRVPTAEFDATVAEARRLGRVVVASTSGTDVSGEVQDVAARLKSLVAARGQLQTLLARAQNVGEVLAVQQKITETQTQIEQLQARQASLADRTTYGSVEVFVHEKGAIERERTGFAKAWHDAVDGFVSAAQAVVAASGTIAFVLLVLGLLTLLLRPLYRSWVRRMV